MLTNLCSRYLLLLECYVIKFHLMEFFFHQNALMSFRCIWTVFMHFKLQTSILRILWQLYCYRLWGVDLLHSALHCMYMFENSQSLTDITVIIHQSNFYVLDISETRFQHAEKNNFAILCSRTGVHKFYKDLGATSKF
jgi:hypothetical protein